MRKLISSMLVVSVLIYSTPLKADSYDNYQEMFTEDSETQDGSCQVSPDRSEALPNEEQPVYASDPDVYAQDQSPEQKEDLLDQGNYTDQETSVTPEDHESVKRGRYKYWKNILLAVVVVAVAVTALLVVHSHEGHKSHH
jgi:hypothetical protein